jgi:hypothetical protein
MDKELCHIERKSIGTNFIPVAISQLTNLLNGMLNICKHQLALVCLVPFWPAGKYEQQSSCTRALFHSTSLGILCQSLD